MKTITLLLLVFLILISAHSYLAVGILYQDEIPSLKLSNELLILSQAMHDIDSVDSLAVPSFLNPVKYLTNCFSSEVLIATNDESGYISVSFGATASLMDIIVNFYQIACTYYGPNGAEIEDAGRVHNGQNDVLFNTGLYDEIEKEVMSLYKSNQTYSVHVTGHSQGGALSVLLAPMLAKSNPNMNISAITFGQPRCVKNQFKEWSRKLTNLGLWQIVLRRDPIPRSPGSWRGYRHAGHLIQLEDNGSNLYYQHTGGDGYASVSENWEGENEEMGYKC